MSLPIAIVGMACRFPGGANDPDAYWERLMNGVDAVTEIPADRFDADALYDPNPDAPGRIYTKHASFLQDVDVAAFDAAFFGIPPVEARRLDPQQRLLLEVAWEAVEDAGIPAEVLAAAQAGVFVGNASFDYARLLNAGDDLASYDAYSFTGNTPSVLSGRLSYVLGLQGPNIAVDTACSSSLVAVHLAVQSLRAGECRAALAAGVNLILTPHEFLRPCRIHALAPDGRSKPFDARGDGYGRGEGCGVVVLKRLADAQADGDRILAVIRGSATNHGGHASGVTVPNPHAQAALIQRALDDAGARFSDLAYFEAHGTGTPVGDAAEFAALLEVGRDSHSPDRPLALGSVKANIGHLEPAAGIAGLIKAVLALRHGRVPPHPTLRAANPAVTLDDIPAVIPTSEWLLPTTGAPRLIGVNSFGLGGTNAHVVVEEAPVAPAVAATEARELVLPLSARSHEALRAVAARYQTRLAATSDPAAVRDACFTAAARRTHHRYRASVVGTTGREIADRLGAWLADARGASATDALRHPRLAFVLPGLGSQWPAMGRALMAQEPEFRAAVLRCASAMRPYLDWSLLDVLEGDEAASEAALQWTDRVQPAIFAMQYALVALWRSWGIEPQAIVGHSMAEMLAAHVAGALTLERAVRIVCLRSRLMRRVSGRGGMAAIGLPAEEVAALLGSLEDRLSLAVVNSPRSCVVSGDHEALATLTETLSARGVFCRPVRADVAVHSPQLDPLLQEMRDGVAGIPATTAEVPLYSTVTGGRIAGPELDADHWVRNMRRTVRFTDALGAMVDEGCRAFLEVSAHPVLTYSIQESLSAWDIEGWALPSLRRGEGTSGALLPSLGALYALGQTPRWERIQSGRATALPTYPWQRERHWSDAAVTKPASDWRGGTRAAAEPRHPLLIRHVRSAERTGAHFFEADVGTAAYPYLAEHRVRGAVIFPGAAYLEMALAAAQVVWGDAPVALHGVSFQEALFVPDSGAACLQLALTERGTARASFHFYSRMPAAGTAPHAAPTTAHAGGEMHRLTAAATRPPLALDDIRRRCVERIDGPALYAAMRERGYDYEGAFQGVAWLTRGDGEALGRLELPASLDTRGYGVHPALLDACFQVALGALPRGSREDEDDRRHDAFLPVAAAELRRRAVAREHGPLWGHAVLRQTCDAAAACTCSVSGHDTPRRGVHAGEKLTGDVELVDDAGQVLLEVRGLRLLRLPAAGASARWNGWGYQVSWQPAPTPAPSLDPKPGLTLLLADRDGIGTQLAARLKGAGVAAEVVPAGSAIDAALRGRAVARVVDLAGLDLPAGAGANAVDAGQSFAVERLGLIPALAAGAPAPRLYLATRGAFAVPGDTHAASLAAAPLVGLRRVAAVEHPELRPTHVDLPVHDAPYADMLCLELLSDGYESEVARRADARYVSRLLPWSEEAPAAARVDPTRPVATGETVHLAAPPDAVLANLGYRAVPRRAPGPGEIELEVEASSIIFRDVLVAMGLYPTLPDEPPPVFGGDYAGRVVRVGEGVTHLRVGDAIVAVANAGLGRYVTLRAALAVPKPEGLGFEEAASLPNVYGTAILSLVDLARVRHGERVLIHAASGGVGLAAVHVARALGATVLATAGSDEKRDYLRSLGIAHVFDSRTLDWVEGVQTATGGAGVDAVLSALSGDGIAAGLSVLAPFGRFVELGKRDIYADAPLPLLPFRKMLGYFSVDLFALVRTRPEAVHSLVARAIDGVRDGAWPLLPVRTFPFAEASAAFEHMAHARHIGKVVLTMPAAPADAAAATPASQRASIRADARYLVTGGTGALGLVTAQWLVARGARHLTLVGRRAPTADAASMVADLEKAGATVTIARGDVASAEDVARIVGDLARSGPPLRGVIHAAGLTEDAPLARLDAARWNAVQAAKVRGAWNLHEATATCPLDFFVLYSSVASVLGSAGQANYAAANAFMDALAHARRTEGRPALSINWGPWSDVGMAARLDERLRQRLADQGLRSVSPRRGQDWLDRLLLGATPPAHVGVFRIDWPAYLQSANGTAPSLVAEAAAAARTAGGATGGAPAPTEGADLRRELAEAPAGRRRALLQQHVAAQVGRVLGYGPGHVVDPTLELAEMGLDSLRSVELRNRLQTSTGLTLRGTLAFDHPTVRALTDHIAGALLDASAPTPNPDTRVETEDPALVERVKTLSDAEIDARMRRILED
jgi:acyl transferase domain-containing protein/NAD(P)-dependent dehydrogenase (short-subunit alcohol dehydrogenase family)